MNLVLNFNEEVIFALRSLYQSRGYSQYKMSKFEEYDLYARNKDFLISEGVITFTDTNGKLMALKPDVTLSIIKNIKEQPKCVQKLYYNENVYRISKGSRSFKEIMQVGLECFGNIDDYNICEVITLAAQSLKSISNDCVLDISHLGLLENVIDTLGVSRDGKADILKCIGEKNTHELTKICAGLGVSDQKAEVLKKLATANGDPDEVLPELEKALEGVADTAALKQLFRIISSVDSQIKDIIRIDFSVVSDVNYYNGIVFKGFVKGVPASVLSGGQYDKLMKKLKRTSGAIGFAVYLDMLERLTEPKNEYDVDVLLIYDDSTDLAALNECVASYTSLNKSVMPQREIPLNIKYKQLIKLTDGEVEILENNA